MARIVITETADADIKDIIAYLTREAGRTLATRYARAFDAAYDRLADFPGIGARSASCTEDETSHSDL